VNVELLRLPVGNEQVGAVLFVERRCRMEHGDAIHRTIPCIERRFHAMNNDAIHRATMPYTERRFHIQNGDAVCDRRSRSARPRECSQRPRCEPRRLESHPTAGPDRSPPWSSLPRSIRVPAAFNSRPPAPCRQTRRCCSGPCRWSGQAAAGSVRGVAPWSDVVLFPRRGACSRRSPR
jgi:hypothetical protein